MIACSLIGSCAAIETVKSPELPGRDWHLYSDLNTGIALALPREWRAFDLSVDSQGAVEVCAASGLAGVEKATRVRALDVAGVAFFACDSGNGSAPQSAIAYAVKGPAPSIPLDKYLTGLPQAPGRRVTDLHFEKVPSGVMAIQKVVGAFAGLDGTSRLTVQAQYFIVRFAALHGLFIEFLGADADRYSGVVDLIGRTFTPLR